MAKARDILKSRLKVMVIDFVCGFWVGMVLLSKSTPDPDQSFGDLLCGAAIVGLLFALFGRHLWRRLARAHKTGILTRRAKRAESKSPD